MFIGWALAQSSGGAKDLQKCFDAPRFVEEDLFRQFLAGRKTPWQVHRKYWNVKGDT